MPTRLLYASAIALALATGCTSWVSVNRGRVATPGVHIESPPAGIDLVGGQDFVPSFSIPCHEMGREDQPLVIRHPEALALGARRVRVTVPDHDQSYYGLLAFCQVVDGATAPGARSYELMVDPGYVEEASGGRVSVMYESYTYDLESYYGWILWLSDRPF